MSNKKIIQLILKLSKECLGMTKSEFLEACKEDDNAKGKTEPTRGSIILVQAIVDIMGSECNLEGEEQELIMCASDWLKKIRDNVDEHLHFLLPKSPTAFSKALSRKASLLANFSLRFEKTRNYKGRSVKITHLPKPCNTTFNNF